MSDMRTLWSPGGDPDAQMLAYTVGDDREVDARLLRWDILGSLGHVEALAEGGVVSAKERSALRKALLAALAAYDAGELRIAPAHEDGHSAVEFWLTERFGDVGERLHTGRSRNDQVATDLRLYLKRHTLELNAMTRELAARLIDFAARHRKVVWPGYTHQRVAMPSSAALWAMGYAEGLLNASDAIIGFWADLDRCPLGSAAGYGVPLPLDREAAARALGFGGIDQVVTSVQNGRGKLEAAVLFWCGQIALECAKLSADVILFSAQEFGWLRLPAALSTGSSIMPHKRNPDLFELTRGRAALIDGELATVLALRAKLPGGYHRDFQLLKAPLFRGLDRTSEMLGMLASAVPRLEVDAVAARRAMHGDVFATDEAVRRARLGTPFRQAYRQVASELKRGDEMPPLSNDAVLRARTSSGGMGSLPIAALRARIRAARAWNDARHRRFAVALAKLIARRP